MSVLLRCNINLDIFMEYTDISVDDAMQHRAVM